METQDVASDVTTGTGVDTISSACGVRRGYFVTSQVY